MVSGRNPCNASGVGPPGLTGLLGNLAPVFGTLSPLPRGSPSLLGTWRRFLGIPPPPSLRLSLSESLPGGWLSANALWARDRVTWSGRPARLGRVRGVRSRGALHERPRPLRQLGQQVPSGVLEPHPRGAAARARPRPGMRSVTLHSRGGRAILRAGAAAPALAIIARAPSVAWKWGILPYPDSRIKTSGRSNPGSDRGGPAT